jgi:hypothetical protein
LAIATASADRRAALSIIMRKITPRYHLKFPLSGFCFLSGGTDRGTLWRSYAPPFSNLSMLLLAVTGIVDALGRKARSRMTFGACGKPNARVSS